MPKRKPSIESHTFRGEGLVLKVTREGRKVTMRVVEQDERLRWTRHTRTAWQTIARVSECKLCSWHHPQISPVCQTVYIRGGNRDLDAHVVKIEMESIAAARSLVRIIGVLVSKVRLPGAKA